MKKWKLKEQVGVGDRVMEGGRARDASGSYSWRASRKGEVSKLTRQVRLVGKALVPPAGLITGLKWICSLPTPTACTLSSWPRGLRGEGDGVEAPERGESQSQGTG